MRYAALLAGSLALAGCYRNPAPWLPMDSTYESGGWFRSHFVIELPEGWMRLNRDEGLMASRDGFALQAIRVREVPAGKELPHTKKIVRAGMSPQDLAEILVDDVRSNGSVKALKVLDTRPATIAGARGFRTTIAFKDEDGLKMRAVLAGAFVGDTCWQLTYVAPARHYFELDLPTFEKALASFRVK